MLPLGNTIRKHINVPVNINVLHYCVANCITVYADDTQFYLSIKPDDTNQLVGHVLNYMKTRMT